MGAGAAIVAPATTTAANMIEVRDLDRRFQSMRYIWYCHSTTFSFYRSFLSSFFVYISARACVSFAISRLHVLMFVRIHELSSFWWYILWARTPITRYFLFLFFSFSVFFLFSLLFFVFFFFVFVKVKAQLTSNLIRGIIARFSPFLLSLVFLFVNVSSEIYRRLFRFWLDIGETMAKHYWKQFIVKETNEKKRKELYMCWLQQK